MKYASTIILASAAALWLSGYFVFLAMAQRTEGSILLLLILVASIFDLFALGRGLWARPRLVAA